MTDSKETNARFRNAIARVNQLQKELDLAQHHLQEVREEIRAAGYFEPDSLFCLSDGEDNHLLSIIISYLTIEEMGRCELVSRGLKQVATYCWEKIENGLILSVPFRTAPNARNSRERVVWYHCASNLAEYIGSMGENISRHDVEPFLDVERGALIDIRRVPNCCQGCNFPDCNLAVLRETERDNFELFVRFSRTHDNLMFAEGFFPHKVTYNFLEIPLQLVDFSNWPNMTEVTRMAIGYHSDEDDVHPQNDEFQLFDESLHQIMRDLTVTVIAVDKRNSQSSMVIAQNNFAAEIDNMGRYGFCWPQGEMSLHSHGAIELRSNPRSKLGMGFINYSFFDTIGSSRVFRTECAWTLQILLGGSVHGVN